jgi:hypothetical protein
MEHSPCALVLTPFALIALAWVVLALAPRRELAIATNLLDLTQGCESMPKDQGKAT